MLNYSNINIQERLKNKTVNLFFETIKRNESLTSWICRNALSSYVNPNDFVSKWINSKTAIHRDFDLKPIEDVFEWMIYMSLKRENNLSSNIRLNDIENAFNKSKLLHSPFIFNGTHIYQRKIKPQFCPLCLKSKKPYFKLDWKVSLIFGCSNCGCFLETECFNCSNTQQLFKLKVFNEDRFTNLNECSICNSSLADNPTLKLTKKQISLNSWITDKIGLNGLEKQNSELISKMFDLSVLLCSGSRIGVITREHFNYEDPKKPFIFLNSHQRAEVLVIVKDWCSNFENTLEIINNKNCISNFYWRAFINQ